MYLIAPVDSFQIPLINPKLGFECQKLQRGIGHWDLLKRQALQKSKNEILRWRQTYPFKESPDWSIRVNENPNALTHYPPIFPYDSP